MMCTAISYEIRRHGSWFGAGAASFIEATSESDFKARRKPALTPPNGLTEIPNSVHVLASSHRERVLSFEIFSFGSPCYANV